MTYQTINVPLEVKSVSGREFDGYGAVFGNVDYGGDIITRGAFRDTLKQHKKDNTQPLMFWMHDSTQVPGIWKTIREDDEGLHVSGEVLDTTLGKDVQILLSKKAVRGLSIGYRPVDVDWRDDGIRLLKKIDLFEVSIVSLAMNPLAKIESVKTRLSSEGEYVPTERELEAHFRKLGCSKNVARTLCVKLFGGKSSTGEMPEGDRWDAGNAEEAEAVKALRGLSDSLLAASLDSILKGLKQ